MRFCYDMYKGNGLLNPFPVELEANSLGHALQKIAAALSDNATSVNVWRSANDSTDIHLRTAIAGRRSSSKQVRSSVKSYSDDQSSKRRPKRKRSSDPG